MSKKKALFISYDLKDFFGEDFRILSKHYDAKSITVAGLFDLIKKKWSIWKEVGKRDIVVVWFGSMAAFVATIYARLRKKKSVIISGGFDVLKMKDIKYGLYLNPIRGFFASLAFRLCDEIVFFSKDSKYELKKNAKIDKGVVSYLSVDPKQFKPAKKKEALVVTVGVVKRENLKRKGLETFVKAAEGVPNARFVLIGRQDDDSIGYLKSIAPPNVLFEDVGHDLNKIAERVGKAKVYVQVSGHEGFGRSLVEGMSCECVPVVTKRGALPEVVGDTGYYVRFENVEETSKAIKQALTSEKGKKARKRVLEKFTTKQRESSLINIINRVLE
ncbi:MAG: glycosyltransferase family 4 protein [archaeon]